MCRKENENESEHVFQEIRKKSDKELKEKVTV